MSKQKEMDAVDRLRLFEDSQEVAEGVWHECDTYWNKEAATHIIGLWDAAKDLARIVRKYNDTN